MGLANDLGHSKMKAIIWVLVSSGFGGDIWTRQESNCEYIQKQSKALNRQGNEVTSFAQYIIDQNLDLKAYDTIKIKLKDSSDLETDTEPSNFCFDVISVMGCPSYLETVTGALPSEWKVLV